MSLFSPSRTLAVLGAGDAILALLLSCALLATACGRGASPEAEVLTSARAALGSAPSAVADTASSLEDTFVDVNVLANDTGLSDTPITVAVTKSPGHGTALVNPDKTIRYTPAANYFGQDTFTYRVTDADGDVSSAPVTVTLAPVNDGAPVANPDSMLVGLNSPGSHAVLANDSKLMDTPVTVSIASPPSHGTAVANSNGTVTYTPATGYSGADSFVYRVTDRDGDSATATVSVTVSASDGVPSAQTDWVTTVEDTPITTNILANDNGLSDTPLVVVILAGPNLGTAQVNGDNSVTYTPPANYYGADSYTYRVTDSDGQYSDGTVILNITSVDDGAPVANADSFTTPEDTVLIAAVLANDLNAVDFPLAVIVTSAPSHGTAVSNNDGTVTYTPAANYDGPDAFSYRVMDRDGQFSDANVSITVTAVDDGAPIANADTASVVENQSVATSVLSNDGQLRDAPITVSLSTAPAHGTAVVNPDLSITYSAQGHYSGTDVYAYRVTDADGQFSEATVTVTVTPVNDGPPSAQPDFVSTPEDVAITSHVLANDPQLFDGPYTVTLEVLPAHGVAVVNADLSITYAPDAHFNGVDVLTYRVTDLDGESSTSQLTVTVLAVNDGAPVAVADAVSTNEDVAVTTHVLANDAQLFDAPISLTLVALPAHGTLVRNGDNSITYTPSPNFNGADTYVYRVTDADGESSDGTVSITVVAVNDGVPVAVPDALSTNEDTAATVNALANDSQLEDAPVTVSVVAPPLSGNVVVNADRSITYTPSPNFYGSDSFTYRVTDADGESADAVVSINVISVSDGAPIARADSAVLNEDSSANTNVLANDGNLIDTPITVTLVRAPEHGAAVVQADLSVTYTPVANYAGTDSYDYRLTSANGETSQATVALTIGPVDDGPPVAVADVTSATEDVPLTTVVLANDLNLLDEPITVSVTTAPLHGSVVVNANGSITYTPAANFNGADSYAYTVTDLDGQSSTALVSFPIAAVNDAPGATSDSASTMTGSSGVLVNVLANDSDVEGDALTLVSAQAGAHGAVTVVAPDSVQFVPAPGFVGTETFTYLVQDSQGAQSVGTVTVAVLTDDTDGDGLSDAVELANGLDPNDADCDDDGVLDGAEPSWNQDFDADGLVNARDPDSDNDGIFDGTERGVSTAPAGTNVAARNFVADADPSTTTNPLEADTDGGGLNDGVEDPNHNGRIDSGEQNPNDASDDQNNSNDFDGDGLSNEEELHAGSNPYDADSDDDGVADGAEPNWTSDTDYDGLINVLDEDSDDDGLFDGTELGVSTPTPGTNLAAGRFLADLDPSSRTQPLDADSDRDGLTDGKEDLNRNGRFDPGETDPGDALNGAGIDGPLGIAGGGCSSAAGGVLSPLALMLMLLRVRRSRRAS